MLNTVAKGSKKELEIKKIYEKKGYIVEKTVRARGKASQDFFGGADLLCMNDDELIFVAVTSKNNRARARKKLLAIICPKKTEFRKIVWFYDGKIWENEELL